MSATSTTAGPARTIVRVPDYPKVVSPEAKEFLAGEQFLPVGRLLSNDELIRARFAYERVWEANPLPEEERAKVVPGTRALTMDKFLHEPDLASILANEFVLRIAEAALGTGDIEFAGGYLHRQRLQRPWEFKELGWPGWHQDGKASLDPLTHINVWIYLDTLDKHDGLTQVLLGSVPLQRENLRAGRDPNTGMDALKAEQDGYETGVFTAGVAGGGFAWSGSIVHRITPNRSGVGRRLITYEYKTRQRGENAKSLFRDKTTPQQRSEIARSLPPDKRWLVQL